VKVKQIRFRLIFPVVYAIVAFILFAGCFESLGHSTWCQLFLNSMFPTQWFSRRLLEILISRGTIAPESIAWTFLVNALTVPVPLLATLIQYYLIGLVVDKVINRLTVEAQQAK